MRLSIRNYHVPFTIPRLVLLVMVASLGGRALAQSDFNSAPINYESAVPTDRISRLSTDVSKGNVKLDWDEKHGWLPSILEQLEVPRSSQTLVFSKTSMQFRRINPRHPRAVYFNDDVYVGWVAGGTVLELGAVDEKLGAVFYSMDQKESSHPEFKRDNGECMACHASGRTQKVPGFLVRSVYPKMSGQPDFRLGSITADHATSFKDSFGGWYVTGTHGQMRHRGNAFAKDAESHDPIDREVGSNLVDLPTQVRSGDYLESSSDIVALLLMTHQTQMHNFVTKAGYTCRTAMFQQQQMNTILDRPADYLSESTVRRVNAAADRLVEYLFFCDEFHFTSPVQGNSDFATEFMAAGIRDSKGRSLRDLDLSRRLLKYPCSYLVYTESFRALPPMMLERVRQRMVEVLSGEDQSDQFSHLSEADRQETLEILTETHPLFSSKEAVIGH